MALFRKLFYRKPPEGLLEICERVYVFDCCFTTDALEEKDYKGYVGGIVTQLRENYPDASILAFNFREGETQSQIGNALSEYDMTLMEYPRHYEGCPLLPMQMIHHFLRSSESWLSFGLQNLLLMHCERGGWPVLAFMLTALLIYRKHYSGELKTLYMVYKQAPRELLHFLSPLNPVPSQLRYLQYVSRRNIATQWPPLDRALTLDCIMIRMIPNVDGEGGCRPIFRIYGQDPSLDPDSAPKVIFSTPKKSRTVRHYKQAECEIVKVDIDCHIQGDVVLECISLYDDMEREVMMFRVMFNTAFIRSNILILNRDEIDVLWDSKDLFPNDFRAEVLFSEVNTAATMVPVDNSCFEEKDGLPVEAFAKVQEIFSADWLSPKGNAAAEVLQHLATNTVIEAYSHSKKSQVKQSLAELEVKSPKDLSLEDQSIPNASPPPLEDAAIIKPAASCPSAENPKSHDKVIEDRPSNSKTDLSTASSGEDFIEAPGVTNHPPSPPSSGIHSSSISPSTTLSSSLNATQATGGGSPSPHLSCPNEDTTLKIKPLTPPPPNVEVALIKGSSTSVCGPSPATPLPPPSSPSKENSKCVTGTSNPPFIPYLTDSSAADRPTSCPPPHPPPPPPPPPPPSAPLCPHETSSIVGGPPLSAPPPHAPEIVPPPPSTPPLREISVTRPVPCPPPPPPGPPKESSSGESSPTYTGNGASILSPPSKDGSVTGPAPCPPPPPSQPPKEISSRGPPSHSGHGATNLTNSSPPPPSSPLPTPL